MKRILELPFGSVKCLILTMLSSFNMLFYVAFRYNLCRIKSDACDFCFRDLRQGVACLFASSCAAPSNSYANVQLDS